ncbi:MAG: hypothetical protein BGO45_06265 [Microbacterium sp. 71-36]|uniref:hypothetical protein n=1 Tax=unclassified Microbacterium TaxID=2609290 RepID=UPI00086AE06F|nr:MULTISPECIES: hypothetical protein [unclassified Microbacterium]MBN9211614.1 hypothetical protein [Microbacterium sp.]ODT38726.1 MAG: hypothetical protein ABS60_09525 [Microbacterium sp. SCN 71-17]ODU52966.1 MAG: hypothetical protein ABT07_00095 [Microbacterium sp. SCN 70-10]OJV75285.1 MAG: hypothetical protein BGO45_06265 [Microbacterium sp. 71-36]
MTPTRTPTITGFVALAALSLAGCTAEAAGPDSPAPTVSTAPATPSPDAPNPDAQSDEALLPIPAAEIGDWAETAVPASEGTALTGRLSGWLSENTSPRQRNSFATLPAGSYQAQLACRGSGTITMSAGELAGDPPTATASCSNSTVAFEIPITQTGMTMALELEGAPSIYAISLIKMT